MAQAHRDQNRIPVIIGVSSVDFATPVEVAVNPTTHALLASSTANVATTPTQSSVSGSATNVTLLISNSSRLGATIYNESTAILYLKLGSTATTSSYTIQLNPSDYYEVPFAYTGRIDGIWASANGAARITELT